MRPTGFTLVELTVVLLLITLLASVAVRETAELGFQTRYEQTKDRLEMIRQAILGNPRQIINGQQAVSGFVADMGRLPNNLRELLAQCSDGASPTQGDCTTNGGTWVSSWGVVGKCVAGASITYTLQSDCPITSTWTSLPANLNIGWRGPYINISGNPADNDAFTDGWGRLAQGHCSDYRYTDESNCTAALKVWTSVDSDFNYGWWTAVDSDNLKIQSYGKDQIYSVSNDYNGDFPSATSQPFIREQDWKVNISGGVSVNFKKAIEKIPPLSLCSDPLILNKADCTTALKTWRGGCPKAGFVNKDSCEVTPGIFWKKCADGTSTDKLACETAGYEWYGEGFGCSDQQYRTKETCLDPSITPALTWRSCSDDGTITTESTCLAANQIWYGSPEIPPTICMKIFYRQQTSMIGVLVSGSISIVADGSYQSVRFDNFKDEDNNPLTDIPTGSHAIAVYRIDSGSCKDSIAYFPPDRHNPIQVDFQPRTTLPVINW
ncbi:MAG: prepilin-type N-terminal cleavage/methylation domain-containing protein [Methylobacter sp.]|nr:prepilin-type N-terminal cleavage/methylation domain-containing protein [Methylobacter sp.]